jgi:membrane protein implicated in regulation of membrane protease activity
MPDCNASIVADFGRGQVTFVWACAFAVMVAADLLMAYVSSVPHSVGIFITVIALYAAIKFTERYPQRQRTARQA